MFAEVAWRLLPPSPMPLLRAAMLGPPLVATTAAGSS